MVQASGRVPEHGNGCKRIAKYPINVVSRSGWPAFNRLFTVFGPTSEAQAVVEVKDTPEVSSGGYGSTQREADRASHTTVYFLSYTVQALRTLAGASLVTQYGFLSCTWLRLALP